MKPRIWLSSTLVTAWAFVASLLGPAVAQEAAPKAETPADAPYALRFNERYIFPKDGRPIPGAIGTYRVAFKQTIEIVTDKPRAAPTRETLVRQAVYAERPARASVIESGKVLALVRRYETVRLTPDPRSKPSDPWPMDGLVVWFQEEPGTLPKILSLSPGRSLRDQDYRFAADQVAVPDLAACLPYPLAVRVGDTYRLTPEGVTALVNGPVAGGGLEGKVLDLSNDPKTGKRIARLEISGRLVPATGGTLALRAQVDYAFAPPVIAASAAADTSARKAAQAIDVFGGIVKVSMAQTELGEPGTAQRPRRTVKRQLLLERQIDPDLPPLEIPNPIPAETPENSWLSYAEPKSRFHFRHPQQYEIQRNAPAGALFLTNQPAEGEPSEVKLFFADKFSKTPEEVFRQMFEGVKNARGSGLVPGGNENLNWPGVRVLRREALLKPSERGDADAGGKPTQLDGYVLQFSGGATLIVEATAPKDQAAAARKEVEAFLKTFQLGPPKRG